MSDPFIAFLPQPVQTLAREGEAAAQVVIDTLQEWVEAVSKRIARGRQRRSAG